MKLARANSGLADDPHWRRFVVRWSIVSLLLIAVAAYNSYGFYQFDEHYQVVEFAGYKLGKTPENALAWEYRAQIRPWLQPGVYYVAARALIAAGVENPFILATAFRVINGLIAWIAILSLMLSANVLFGPGRARRLAVMLLATLWLIPYLAVRTSGESLSGSFLALGIAALLLGSTAETGQAASEHAKRRFPPLSLLLAGICFGLAFEFRFQMAFGVMGVMGWIAFTSSGGIRRRIGSVALIGWGVLPMVALATLVDRWGYGHWVVVPWNYFHTDVLQGRPSLDGTAPIWAYFVKVIGSPAAPIAALWVVAMLVTWVRHPRHVVAWATLPFFVVHSIVPHKELRYMFPIALVATLGFVVALMPSSGGRPQPAWLKRIWRLRHSVWAKALVAFNAAMLVYACFVAHEPSLNFQHWLYDHYPHGCTMYVLGAETRSPFENVGATMFFYRPPNFTCWRLKSEAELAAIIQRGDGDCLVVRDRLSNWSPPAASPAESHLVYTTYPAWVERFNFANWLHNSKRFSLYAVHPLETPNGKAEGDNPRPP
ncbi:MAG TPA: hypothetical protein VHX65_12880, partial [Pirellulales bacterium]|nr:hypothetical protein [Pirellulales bacterium]